MKVVANINFDIFRVFKMDINRIKYPNGKSKAKMSLLFHHVNYIQLF